MNNDSKHYGHDAGEWFYGCDACNLVDMDQPRTLTREQTIDEIAEAIEIVAKVFTKLDLPTDSKFLAHKLVTQFHIRAAAHK